MKEVVAAVMSSYMRYGALSAKVRAMYGKRLRFSDFEHMAAMPSEQSVLEYLRGQPGWTAAVSALDTTGYVGRVELEEALRQQLWKEYRGLSHFVPKGDKLLVAFPVRLAELEDIMTALRRLKAAGHAKPLPASRYEQLESKVDRKALAACAAYDGLLAATVGSIYPEALLHVRSSTAGELPDYTTTEALLRSTYFSHMYRLIHKSCAGETKKVLLRAFGEQVDLLNVIHILRLKTYFPGDGQYYSALFPFNYRLRPEKVKALCDAGDSDAVLALLQDTPYAAAAQAQGASGVEDWYRREFYLFNKRQLVTGEPSLYTAMSYLTLKEMEFKMLVNVIESVKYGAPYDESFARLIGE